MCVAMLAGWQRQSSGSLLHGRPSTPGLQLRHHQASVPRLTMRPGGGPIFPASEVHHRPTTGDALSRTMAFASSGRGLGASRTGFGTSASGTASRASLGGPSPRGWTMEGADSSGAEALPRSVSEYFLHRQSWKPSSQLDHTGHVLPRKWRSIATEGDPPPNASPASFPWTAKYARGNNSLSGLLVLGNQGKGAAAGGARGGPGGGQGGEREAAKPMTAKPMTAIGSSRAGPGQGDDGEEEDDESPWTPRLTHIKAKAEVGSKSFAKAFAMANTLSLEASTYGFSDSFKPSLSRSGSVAGNMPSMGNALVGGASFSSGRGSARAFTPPAIRPGTWHHDSSPRGKYR